MSDVYKEEALLQREHQDPDKHWIGDSLGVPTQSEIAGTIGSVASPGESPFVARADHLHKLGAGVVAPTNMAAGVFDLPAVRSFGVSLADDQAAYVPFTTTGTQYGIFILGSNIGSAGQGIFSFRCGDGSAFCTSIAHVGATVTTGTGTLAGTTGTDGHLTIRANTANARLYLENRTASARVYVITFLSVISNTLIPQAWVIV